MIRAVLLALALCAALSGCANHAPAYNPNLAAAVGNELRTYP